MHLEELRRRGMTFPGSYMSLAEAYVATGQPDKAREALADVRGRAPGPQRRLREPRLLRAGAGPDRRRARRVRQGRGAPPRRASMKIEMGRFAAHALRDEWPEAEAAAKRAHGLATTRASAGRAARASRWRASTAGDVGEARRLAAEGARTGGSAEERVGARLFRARLEADLGRDREALAEAERRRCARRSRSRSSWPRATPCRPSASPASAGRPRRRRALAEVDAFLATIPRALGRAARACTSRASSRSRAATTPRPARPLEKAAALAPSKAIKMDSAPVEIRYALARAALDDGDADGGPQGARARRRGGAGRASSRRCPYVRSLALLAALEEKAGRHGGGAQALRALPRLLEGRPDRPRRGGPRGPAPGRASGRVPRPEPPPMTSAAAALAAGPRGGAPARPRRPAAPLVLRYDLRPGDHLVYRQRLERASALGERRRAVARRSGRRHVLVLGRARRLVARRHPAQPHAGRAPPLPRRTAATGWRPSGRRSLEGLAKRGTTFAETSWLTPSGAALLPWAAVREATSERLPLFHEIEPLPAGPVGAGGVLRLAGPARPADARRRARGGGGEECLRLEGEDAGPEAPPLALPGERHPRPARVRGPVRRPRGRRGEGALPARARVARARRGARRRGCASAEDRAGSAHRARGDGPAGPRRRMRSTRSSTEPRPTSSGSSWPWPGAIGWPPRRRTCCAGSPRARRRAWPRSPSRFLAAPTRPERRPDELVRLGARRVRSGGRRCPRGAGRSRRAGAGRRSSPSARPARCRARRCGS